MACSAADSLELSVKATLCIELPASSSFYEKVQEIRSKHDPAYNRWMPHINLIFPFLPAEGVNLDSLRAKLLQSSSAFRLVFDDIGVFDHGKTKVLFLKPDVRSEEALKTLHKQVLAALPPLPQKINGGKGERKPCKESGKGKGKGKEESTKEEAPGGGEPTFAPHMTLAKPSKGKYSCDDWKAWLREELFSKEVARGIGGEIRGVDGTIWGTVTSEKDGSWCLDSGRTATIAAEGTDWNWHAKEGCSLTFDVSKISLCERDSDTKFAEVAALELGKPGRNPKSRRSVSPMLEACNCCDVAKAIRLYRSISGETKAAEKK